MMPLVVNSFFFSPKFVATVHHALMPTAVI